MTPADDMVATDTVVKDPNDTIASDMVVKETTAKGTDDAASNGDWTMSQRSGRSLRDLCGRIFGWSNRRMIDEVLQTLVTAVSRRGAVALRGTSDPVPVAYLLHQRLFGSERPFVVCDPRREGGDGSVRTPPSRSTGTQAIEAAVGGTVCVRSKRLPADYDELAISLRERGDIAMLFVCLNDEDRIRDLLCPPLDIPSLVQRVPEIDRLFAECLEEAARTLMVDRVTVSGSVRRSILREVSTFAELEKATMRLVALHASQNLSQAAERLGMAPVSLSRWVARRSWEAAVVAGKW
jgi:hypothetical protein